MQEITDEEIILRLVRKLLKAEDEAKLYRQAFEISRDEKEEMQKRIDKLTCEETGYE